MSDGRRSLIGTFAISILLIFVVEHPADLSWGGVTVPENRVWICLLVAHVYFCVMAYTKGAFSPVNTAGASYWEHIADPSVRAHRIGEIFNMIASWVSAVGSTVLIATGILRNI